MNEKLSLSRLLYTYTVYALMFIFTFLTVGIVIFIIGYVFIEAIPYFSIDILTQKPSYITDTIGILPDILNTIYIIVTTVCLVIPLGVGAAIYTQEYATNKTVVKVIEYAIETLAGIPSIIYGLVGMLIFCQFFNLQTSLLAGSLTLTIMTLPIIVRTTQEALKTVPQSYKEGAIGLGAGKFRMIYTIVIPYCIDGIVTGTILSIGRMLGESAALLFTAGFAHQLNGYLDAITSSGATLTVALYIYAKEQGEFEVAFVIAALLLALSLLINLLSTLVAKYYSRKKGLN